MLVDSHCHLPLLELDKHGGSIEAVLATAKEHGVEYFLCISVDLETYPEVRQLAQTHRRIFATVGVHPNNVAAREPTVEQLCQLARDRDVVGVGETGLDYFRSSGDLEWQRERFRIHIAAARKTQKPLVVHMREARKDVMNILKEENADEVGGVMHCFVEDWETAKMAIDLNFYISFSGIVTFKNAPEVQAAAKKVPLDHLLVETDSPYLAPVPYRGKANQPAYVRYVADHIAELKGISVSEIEHRTTANFFNLFKL
jgi:TatD DNase family protein